MIGFVVFTAGPMIASLYLSFTDYSVIGRTHRVGLENYRSLIHDPKVSQALQNTVLYTVLHVPGVMLVSLALAMLLSRVGRSAGIFRTIFYLPVMSPQVALVILFLLLFNGRSG